MSSYLNGLIANKERFNNKSFDHQSLSGYSDFDQLNIVSHIVNWMSIFYLCVNFRGVILAKFHSFSVAFALQVLGRNFFKISVSINSAQISKLLCLYSSDTN